MRGGSRQLTTVLFTDVVGSTARLADVGDEQWRDIRRAMNRVAAAELKRHHGERVNDTGDGMVATFASPGEAIAFGRAFQSKTRDLGLRIRIGVHTGEVERNGDDLVGIGVHIAARVGSLAEGDEIVVSRTVRDLVSGSGLHFRPRGSPALKGVPGRMQLFSVTDGVPEETQAPKTRPTPKRASAAVPKCQILLVDDHPLWRQTLRGLLEHNGATVIGEADTGVEAVKAVRTLAPDIVLMDIDMPEMNGVDATAEIVQTSPEVKVVMLSSVKNRDEVLAAVRAGACGYLIKTATPAEVTDAIARVQRGELAFPSELTQLVLSELRNPSTTGAEAASDDDLAMLTARELDVLRLLAAGGSNKAIAEQIHVSLKTVESHIAAVYMKLGLADAPAQHRRVQAVVRYINRHGTPG